MKINAGRRLRTVLAAAALLPVLILSSCLRLHFPSSRATPAANMPSASEAAVTDFQSGVRTDYSKLTPFQPPEEKFTRLSDGPLPELKPSKEYGRLLPYVGEKFYGDSGHNIFNMFGLVTKDGMIVTDPVYASVNPTGYYDYANFKYMSGLVYDIEKLTEEIDGINKKDPWNSMRHAVCAIDGSWITPFDYTSVHCTDTVIFLHKGLRNQRRGCFRLQRKAAVQFQRAVLLRGYPAAFGIRIPYGIRRGNDCRTPGHGKNGVYRCKIR